MLSIAAVEVCHRGHLITGREDFLQRFRQARARASSSLTQAEELRRGNPGRALRAPRAFPVRPVSFEGALRTVEAPDLCWLELNRASRAAGG